MTTAITIGHISTLTATVTTKKHTACNKCSGYGTLHGHSLPDNNRCYRCDGSGVDPRPHTEQVTNVEETTEKLTGYVLDDSTSLEDILAAYTAEKADEEAACKDMWESFFPDMAW